ncbi:MAG: glycosyltransferase family 2 protein [Actinomycetota bacterium]
MGILTAADPNLVPSLLDQPPALRFSVVALSAGWPEDLRRLTGSLERHCSNVDYEVVAVSNASDALATEIERLAAADPRVGGICFSQHVGFGGGVNAGIHQSRGEVVVVADTSIEATGDLFTPLGAALADPEVGIAGPWGLLSPDLRHFDEETTGDVDAMQAYCMAFRRTDVAEVGLLEAKFKFYRNADIEYSLRWRSFGFRISALPLPVRRHAHREWDALGEEQRRKRSRDNFARFLRAWGDRTDLLTGRAPPHVHDDA